MFLNVNFIQDDTTHDERTIVGEKRANVAEGRAVTAVMTAVDGANNAEKGKNAAESKTVGWRKLANLHTEKAITNDRKAKMPEKAEAFEKKCSHSFMWYDKSMYSYILQSFNCPPSETAGNLYPYGWSNCLRTLYLS